MPQDTLIIYIAKVDKVTAEVATIEHLYNTYIVLVQLMGGDEGA